MKVKVLLFGVLGLLPISNMANADCFVYRPYYIIDGKGGCAPDSARLATLCINEELVQASQDSNMLSTGNFSITIKSLDGELIEAAIYHAKKVRVQSTEVQTDYRASIDDFKYTHSIRRNIYVITHNTIEQSVFGLKIGQRQFCAERE